MPKINGIRFQKQDDYGNYVFIANSDKEKPIYDKLVKYSDQLSKKYGELFSPIYYSDKFNYATIRVVKNNGINTLRLKPNDKVNFSFQISKKQKENGKLFLNCHLNNIKLLYRAPEPDYGEECELYDSDTDTDSSFKETSDV